MRFTPRSRSLSFASTCRLSDHHAVRSARRRAPEVETLPVRFLSVHRIEIGWDGELEGELIRQWSWFFRLDGKRSGVYFLPGKVVLQEWSRSCGRLEWLCVIGLDFKTRVLLWPRSDCRHHQGRFHFDESCADEGRLRFDGWAISRVSQWRSQHLQNFFTTSTNSYVMVRPPCGRVVDARGWFGSLSHDYRRNGWWVARVWVCFPFWRGARCWVRDGIDSPGSRTFGFDVYLPVTGGGMVSRKGGRRGEANVQWDWRGEANAHAKRDGGSKHTMRVGRKGRKHSRKEEREEKQTHPHWKRQGTNIISWRCIYLGCTQRQCEISKDIVDKYWTMFESKISAGATEQLPCSENLSISSWSYDMEGDAKKCVERSCELPNKTIQQLQSISSMHWRPSFQRRRTEIRGILFRSMLSNCFGNDNTGT